MMQAITSFLPKLVTKITQPCMYTLEIEKKNVLATLKKYVCTIILFKASGKFEHKVISKMLQKIKRKRPFVSIRTACIFLKNT